VVISHKKGYVLIKDARWYDPLLDRIEKNWKENNRVIEKGIQDRVKQKRVTTLFII